MNYFSKQVEVRWSDLDPNFHLRHSVYYDFGAFMRTCFLIELGITPELFMKHHFGPILFREECVFKREIKFGDRVVVNASMVKARQDYSRWTIVHEIWKNDNTLAAILTIDGAWMDTAKRKLYQPESFLIEAFDKVPKHEGFVWEEAKQP
ncbi:MAG: acyl-CoA thioesterase [Chitinophagaceae bacterium]